jgi:putative hydrolase of the HAD superfamily
VRAVVFDLWLTLIPFPREVRRGAFERTARALEIEPDELQPHWRATRTERETNGLADHLRNLGSRLGAPWTDAMIEAAMAARANAHADCFANPFPDGAEAIRALRQRGFTIGLVSNCTSDVVEALAATGMDRWFDHVVLSAQVGVMKPAPEIYAMAAAGLGVDAAECLYVGDGNDHELDGAATAGMTAILYDRLGAAPPSAFPTIASHLDLLDLVDRPAERPVDRPGSRPPLA